MRDDDAGPNGLLVAVVGPSGAGKDTLIRLAFDGLADEPRIVLAKRAITRPPDGETEDHESFTDAAFDRAEASGRFCLTWRAHGLAYGLPGSVEDAVRGGRVVVANLSRRSLGDAVARFGRIALVEITAPRAVLVERIAARGRESAAEIERRLARKVGLEIPCGCGSTLTIDNSGPPTVGAQTLRLHLLTLLAQTAGEYAAAKA